MTTPCPPHRKIRLFIADLDGTLVTPEKELTPRAIKAVDALYDAGIKFTITSGRPPRGMSMVMKQLKITAPVSAFNGALFVKTDLSVIEGYTLPEAVAKSVIERIHACGLDVWVYQGSEWLIRNPQAPHVAREQWTVKFAPTVVTDFSEKLDQVYKIVGISDDYNAVARCAQSLRTSLGSTVFAARSQPYYVDVTNPTANKHHVVEVLSRTLAIPSQEIATIGDMPSDIQMFENDGLSIAMGNGTDETKKAAEYITSKNTEEGFANAVEHCVLPVAGVTSKKAA
ncbi:MAG TPA: Cof-type HAD-IIB family hydrolase [Armatimonadota bacterium]|nr:Cof-type HAD-IIB family hydrolase [Armatimonadota bacterium]